MDDAAPHYTVSFITHMLEDFQRNAALGLTGSPLENIAEGCKAYTSGKYVALIRIFDDEVYVMGIYHTARSIAVLLENNVLDNEET